MRPRKMEIQQHPHHDRPSVDDDHDQAERLSSPPYPSSTNHKGIRKKNQPNFFFFGLSIWCVFGLDMGKIYPMFRCPTCQSTCWDFFFFLYGLLSFKLRCITNLHFSLLPPYLHKINKAFDK